MFASLKSGYPELKPRNGARTQIEIRFRSGWFDPFCVSECERFAKMFDGFVHSLLPAHADRRDLELLEPVHGGYIGSASPVMVHLCANYTTRILLIAMMIDPHRPVCRRL